MSFNQPPPPPPPGGTPPPPPDGYGVPPQPGPSDSGQWDLGAAIGYGWAKFQANTAQLIIATLAILGGAIVIFGVYFVVNSAMAPDFECGDTLFDCDYDNGAPGIVRFAVGVFFPVLFLIYAQIVGSGIIRGALGITEGRDFQASEVFKFDNLGPVLVTSLIVGAATFVGTLLCVVPGIIIGFLTSYSLFFVVDKKMAPMDAIKASIDLTKNNLGQTIVWYIVGGIIAQLGFVLCGVGALVSIPVVIIGTAYTYKKLTGQPVVA